MIKIAKPVVKFLTDQYNNKEKGDSDEFKGLLEASNKTEEVANLKITNQKFVASVKQSNIKEKPKETIEYTVLGKDIRRIKKTLNDKDISNKEIGIKTFYYYLKQEE